MAACCAASPAASGTASRSNSIRSPQRNQTFSHRNTRGTEDDNSLCRRCLCGHRDFAHIIRGAMTVTAPHNQSRQKPEFNPENYRMSMGDHLEELRWRLIMGLVGLVLALLFCLWFSDHVIVAFCGPLVRGLQKHQVNPQLFYAGLSDPFMTYIKMSLISAAAIASPWMLYQLWQFVAAGLYPSERKLVTKYIPLSVGLLVGG